MIVAVEYKMIMVVKIYFCVMGNYFTVSYFLRISTIFCFVVAVLISLFYECDG